MENRHSVCFQVGQLAEARTFESGFRGAWFRCKIKKVVRKRDRSTSYVVEYYDYTEESEEKIELYRFPLEGRGGHKAKKELMLRPQFPAFYRESELPDVNSISEVIVEVADVWRVGDLVDWLSDDCFWSGTITDIIDDEMVQITLLEPPRGEGSSYNAKCKDLRPSLDWSPESDWTVPAPLETQSGHLHARVIRPVKQAPPLKSLFDEMLSDKQDCKVTPRSSLEFTRSISSYTSASSLPHLRSIHSKDSLQQCEDVSKKGLQQTHGLNSELNIGGSAIGKPSCSDGVSGTYVRDVSAEVAVDTCPKELDRENESAKKMRLIDTISLNSTACDSIESSILDLEELVNRVKWLKNILNFGISSTPQGPAWEHMEHPAVSTPE